MANSSRSCWLSGLLCWLLLAGLLAAEEPWFAPAARALSRSYAQLVTREDALRSEVSTLPLPPVSQQSERIGWHSQFSTSASATKWLQIDLGREQSFDAVALVPVDVAYGTHPGPGFGFPVRFRVEVSDEAAFAEPRLLAAFDDADFSNPGNAPIFLATPGATGRYVRVTATRLWSRGDRALLVVGEVFVLNRGLNIAAGAPVTVSDAYNNPPTWQPANATDGQSVLGAPIEVMPAPGNGWHARTEASPDLVKWVQVDLGREVPIDEVRLFPARPKDFPARRGFGFPPRFRVEAANDAEFSTPIVLLDQSREDFENPAENPVLIPVEGVAARFVRVTATWLWARTNDFIFALAELEVRSGGENVARSGVVTSFDTIEVPSWSRSFLVDGFNSQGRIVDLAEWLRGLSRRREIDLEWAQIAMDRQQQSAALATTAIRCLVGAALGLVVLFVVWLRLRVRARRREVELLRQRIAGDLHDEIGSNLGSIALLSQMALRQPSEAQADLAEIQRVALETADSMRDLVWFIKPSATTVADFVAKLREVAGVMLGGLEWQMESASVAGPYALEFQRQIFLIFKEALHNVRRHSGAGKVEIVIAEVADDFDLRITDDGCGFAGGETSAGHGLVSMRQRAEAIGGTWSVDSRPGEGTCLQLKVRLTSRLRTATA